MLAKRSRVSGPKPLQRLITRFVTLAALATGAQLPLLATASEVPPPPLAALTTDQLVLAANNAYSLHSKQEQLPLSLLQMRGDYRYAVAVDLSSNQLFVFANNDGVPELISSHFATIGKAGYGKRREGDNRTPVGIYRVQSFISDNALPELYGNGALPLDFPNAWDVQQRRTGHGIWIHGMPRDKDRRPARDSEGCVVVSNALMPALHDNSELKSTPVILADSLRWSTRENAEGVRDTLLDTLEQWRLSWASGDMDAFLGMHDKNFRNAKQRMPAYADQKRRIAAARKKIDIEVDEVEIFMYPDVEHKAMAMVSFKQRYRSRYFKDITYKTQYWQHDGDRWLLQLERNVDAWPSHPSEGKLFARVSAD